jgi:DNA-binding LacI/PurR family transcriptional regulator
LERYHIEQLLQAGAAGILIFPGDHAVERREGRLVSAGDLERVETLARLQRQHVPFVLIDRYVPEIDCDYVVSDDSAAGYAATQHLVALGHRRIGFVSDNAQVTSIADRHAGYVQCLQEHGLPVEESLVVQEGRRLGVRGVVASAQAPGDELSDRATLRAFLQRPDRPTAIVTTNEYVGLHVLHAAEDVGLDVPGDLAIVSCGGADISTHARVPLTSIMQPAADLGRQAAHLLLDRITGRSSASRRVVVPVSLVVRRSCGATPRRAPLAAPSVRA